MGYELKRRAIAVLAMLAAASTAPEARAQPDAARPEPLYPEVVVPTDAGHAADPALRRLRAEATAASEAKVEVAGAQVYDPAVLLPFMTADVEFFVGPGEGLVRNGFTSLGMHPAPKALEMLGSLARDEAAADPLVRQRHAMYEIGRMLADPAVGATPWLDGRICTASYGEVEWRDWMALMAGPGMRDVDWVIAAAVNRAGIEDPATVPDGWPKQYQLLPVSHGQKASAGWMGILTPEGDTAFFRSRWDDAASHFVPYLNDHVCFEQRGGAWKITAIAKRLG